MSPRCVGIGPVTTPSTELRSVVQARRFDRASARPDVESFTVLTSHEMVVPTTKGVPGTAPIATADQIILVLADGRGDIWMMDLEHPVPERRRTTRSLRYLVGIEAEPRTGPISIGRRER